MPDNRRRSETNVSGSSEGFVGLLAIGEVGVHASVQEQHDAEAANVLAGGATIVGMCLGRTSVFERSSSSKFERCAGRCAGRCAAGPQGAQKQSCNGCHMAGQHVVQHGRATRVATKERATPAILSNRKGTANIDIIANVYIYIYMSLSLPFRAQDPQAYYIYIYIYIVSAF